MAKAKAEVKGAMRQALEEAGLVQPSAKPEAAPDPKAAGPVRRMVAGKGGKLVDCTSLGKKLAEQHLKDLQGVIAANTTVSQRLCAGIETLTAVEQIDPFVTAFGDALIEAKWAPASVKTRKSELRSLSRTRVSAALTPGFKGWDEVKAEAAKGVPLTKLRTFAKDRVTKEVKEATTKGGGANGGRAAKSSVTDKQFDIMLDYAKLLKPAQAVRILRVIYQHPAVQDEVTKLAARVKKVKVIADEQKRRSIKAAAKANPAQGEREAA